jgi:hypothetical protein
MRTHATAEAMCEARAPHRLVEPKPIHAKRAQKASWGDPVMLAKLANAYVRAAGDGREGRPHPRCDGRFGPTGRKAAPRCRSNGSSPESLLAGRRTLGSFRGHFRQRMDRQRHALRDGFPSARDALFRSPMSGGPSTSDFGCLSSANLMMLPLGSRAGRDREEDRCACWSQVTA